jgi:hypothetical protein
MVVWVEMNQARKVVISSTLMLNSFLMPLSL